MVVGVPSHPRRQEHDGVPHRRALPRDVPAATAQAVREARAAGGRVELLRAFAPDEALKAALDHAGHEGYLSYEFGDAMVVI